VLYNPPPSDPQQILQHRPRRRRSRMPKLSPLLLAELAKLARAEGIDLGLLLTLLIRDGLNHRRAGT
jgi:hypothetical protein